MTSYQRCTSQFDIAQQLEERQKAFENEAEQLADEAFAVLERIISKSGDSSLLFALDACRSDIYDAIFKDKAESLR